MEFLTASNRKGLNDKVEDFDNGRLNSSNKNVLVIGDVMLDRYYYGTTERMSPEAPVPVVDIDNIVDSPGGSSNVALNLSKLGAQATVCGIIGDDIEGDILKEKLILYKTQFLEAYL